MTTGKYHFAQSTSILKIKITKQVLNNEGSEIKHR